MADDGLPVDQVGAWSLEKHDRLRKYISASRGARRKFLPPIGTGGASYIDLYCGYGKAIIRDTGQEIDGSPLVAFKSARDGGARFSEIHLGDSNDDKLRVSVERIKNAGGVATPHRGTALEAVQKVAEHLNPSGLHFAFLDPFNLQDLPFGVIETLSRFHRMDMIIHVSVQDLQRNLDRYIGQSESPLDVFMTGWRSVVDLNQAQNAIRADLLKFWLHKIRGLGVSPAQGIALVSGEKQQRLYWLVFVSRSNFAASLWEDIRHSGQKSLL
ncbi:MAG TPA: three-Cys-motif partner protein TcmP [Xanthobacteraceae bacterium]|nr:three-Cys-motif partner protein TcmP [Xanthobacteraceae bacterium]